MLMYLTVLILIRQDHTYNAIFGLIQSGLIQHSATTTTYARSEYHTELAKMSFDKIFDLTAGVYFNFYNIYEFRVPPVPMARKKERTARLRY